ncbi:aspartic peptidase domain-containing protein [Lactifluus subvellereus]|nr:aspartic peptidase domain-containing protein [Lactifluus subvellereus]
MVSLFALSIPLFGLLLGSNLAVPINSLQQGSLVAVPTKRSFELPIQRRRTALSALASMKRGIYSGSTGLGDSIDLFYAVAITIGETVTAVNLDTGSSDLWVASDTCKTTVCKNTNMPAYPSANIKPAGGSVELLYGDSLTGTHASGPGAQDVAIITGLYVPATFCGHLGHEQYYEVQAAVIKAKFNTPPTTDDFVLGKMSDGPLLSRLAMSGSLEQPMFAVMLQRDVINISGTNGIFTIGKLPDGIDNSSLTWVPVRLYKPQDGGLNPPNFAPDEIYPLRWEVPIDGVILDGQQLPASQLAGSGSTVSALFDTVITVCDPSVLSCQIGQQLIRGPQDIVDTIFKSVSSAFAAKPKAAPTFSCSVPHDLVFQIGGKTFPIDPRDFISQNTPGDANPPSTGALFSWSLGDPFFKSNLVAFYYGNLMHPSVDPPRIGLLSMVPENANSVVQSDIAQAQANGGNFKSTSQVAPTGVMSAASITIPTITSSASPTVSNKSGAQASSPNSSGRLSESGAVLSTVLLPALFGTITQAVRARLLAPQAPSFDPTTNTDVSPTGLLKVLRTLSTEATPPTPTATKEPSEIVPIPQKDVLSADIISGAPAELRQRINTMQSGGAKGKRWRIDWDILPGGGRWENPLMGWASSADYVQGTRLSFRSQEDAIHFAEKQGWDYYVQPPSPARIPPKNYAENFVYRPHKLRITQGWALFQPPNGYKPEEVRRVAASCRVVPRVRLRPDKATIALSVRCPRGVVGHKLSRNNNLLGTEPVPPIPQQENRTNVCEVPHARLSEAVSLNFEVCGPLLSYVFYVTYGGTMPTDAGNFGVHGVGTIKARRNVGKGNHVVSGEANTAGLTCKGKMWDDPGGMCLGSLRALLMLGQEDVKSTLGSSKARQKSSQTTSDLLQLGGDRQLDSDRANRVESPCLRNKVVKAPRLQREDLSYQVWSKKWV